MIVYHPLLIKQLSIAGIDVSQGPLSADETQRLLGFVNRFYEQILPMDKHHGTDISVLHPETSHEAVILMDDKWRITHFNHEAKRLLGLGAEHHKDALFPQLFTLMNTRQHPLNLARLIDFFDCGQVYVCRNGVIWHHQHPERSLFARFSLTPVMGAEQPELFILRLQDITPMISQRANEVQKNIEAYVTEYKRYHLLDQTQKKLMVNIHNGLLAHQLKHISTDALDDKLCQFSSYMSLQNNSHILRQVSYDYDHIEKDLPSEHMFDLHKLSGKITEDLQKITGLTLVTVDCSNAERLQTDPLSVVLMVYQLSLLLILNCKALKHMHLEVSTEYVSNQQQQQLCIALNCDTSFDIPLPKTLEQDILNQVNANQQHKVDIKLQKNNVSIHICRTYHIPTLEHTPFTTQSHDLRVLGIGLSDAQKSSLERFKGRRIETLDFCCDYAQAIPLFKQQRLRQREYHLVFIAETSLKRLKSDFYEEIISYIHDDFISLIAVSDTKMIDEHDDDMPLMHIEYSHFFKNLPSLFDEVLIKQFCRHSQLSHPLLKKSSVHMRFVLHDLESCAEPLYKRAFSHMGIDLLSPEATEAQGEETMPIHGVLLNLDDPGLELLREVSTLKEQYPQKPLVLMSPTLNEEEYLLWIKAGIDEVLFKPFTLAEMINVLYKCSTGVEQVCSSTK